MRSKFSTMQTGRPGDFVPVPESPETSKMAARAAQKQSGAGDWALVTTLDGEQTEAPFATIEAAHAAGVEWLAANAGGTAEVMLVLDNGRLNACIGAIRLTAA